MQRPQSRPRVEGYFTNYVALWCIDLDIPLKTKFPLQALLRGAISQQSAVILICMAMDRYLCMLHPARYHKHSSKKASTNPHFQQELTLSIVIDTYPPPDLHSVCVQAVVGTNSALFKFRLSGNWIVGVGGVFEFLVSRLRFLMTSTWER